ncbi:MAG: PRTRC system protein C [Alistipes sp.]|jgi:PRTRC genetic system protein C|nr:PRTRC system protein C [Alistipes sp.]
MALQVEGLQREFRFKHNGTTITLPDPDAGRSPEQVMQFYANQYPELTTASVGAAAYEGERVVYEFKTTLGTKG